MSVLPYLPAGVAELPAERFVIFADSANRVQRFDESSRTYDGEEFDSFWESASLNKEGIGRLWKLLSFRVHYFCEAAIDSAIFRFSPDGGETWVDAERPLVATSGLRMRTVTLYPRIVGEDLRVRIEFHPTVIFNVVGFNFEIIPAGEIVKGGVS